MKTYIVIVEPTCSDSGTRPVGDEFSVSDLDILVLSLSSEPLHSYASITIDFFLDLTASDSRTHLVLEHFKSFAVLLRIDYEARLLLSKTFKSSGKFPVWMCNPDYFSFDRTSGSGRGDSGFKFSIQKYIISPRSLLFLNLYAFTSSTCSDSRTGSVRTSSLTSTFCQPVENSCSDSCCSGICC